MSDHRIDITVILARHTLFHRFFHHSSVHRYGFGNTPARGGKGSVVVCVRRREPKNAQRQPNARKRRNVARGGKRGKVVG